MRKSTIRLAESAECGSEGMEVGMRCAVGASTYESASYGSDDVEETLSSGSISYLSSANTLESEPVSRSAK